MALRRIRLNPAPQHEEESQKILYVEDEDDNWEVAELALRKRYALTRAKTAREAFEILAKQSFEIILMDIQLSGSELDGIEITKVLRGIYERKAPAFTRDVDCHGARIIFVTAYSAKYKRKELIEVGGDELITKPVDFTRLSLAISRLVVREAFDQQTEVKKLLDHEKNLEGRQQTRVGVQLDCFVTYQDTLYSGQIDNLSTHGACVQFGSSKRPMGLQAKDALHVAFWTSWGRIESEASIAWSDMEIRGVIGLEFTKMSNDSTSVLEQWLSFENLTT